MKPIMPIAMISVLWLPAGMAEQWWQEVDESSNLNFTAEQQGAAFEGRFEQFESHICFDPSEAELGYIKTIIDLTSVNTESAERDEQLPQSDWFHTEKWPQAMFETSSIKANGDGYIAQANLTIRDQTKPVEFHFKFSIDEDTQSASLTGSAILKRLDFGVGQGDWASTEWIADEVIINTQLKLVKIKEHNLN